MNSVKSEGVEKSVTKSGVKSFFSKKSLGKNDTSTKLMTKNQDKEKSAKSTKNKDKEKVLSKPKKFDVSIPKKKSVGGCESKKKGNKSNTIQRNSVRKGGK